MPLAVDSESLQLMIAAGGPPPVRHAVHDIESRRANSALGPLLALAPDHDDITQKDFYVAAPDGHQVLARWYTQNGSSPGSAFVYYHGGGMIQGSVEMFNKRVRDLVHNTGVPALAVDYRLSPEVHYPVPNEDAYAALSWLSDHAAELGVDPARIAVMGDSAGGLVAASVALLARERKGPKIARQILLYPMLDDRTTVPDPFLKDTPVWNIEDNITGWTAYLGELYGTDKVPETAAPGRLVDATGLPPTYIDVGDMDTFRDEDVAYATKLWKAGVNCELHVVPGAIHGFDLPFAGTRIVRVAMEARINFIRSI